MSASVAAGHPVTLESTASIADGLLTLRPGGRYDFAQGSSIAAAHVSGAMALLLAMPSGMEPPALAELLRNGGKERGDPAPRLSVDTAVEALSTRQRQSAKR